MYNMAQYLIFIILNIFIITGSTFKCPICSKEDCNKVEIPILDCNDTFKGLKYGFLTSSSEDSTLACVSLEYEIESEGKIPVRQCLKVSPTENLCKDISVSLPESIKLISCDFEFSEKFELDMVDSFYISTTEESITTEESSTTEELTTTETEKSTTTTTTTSTSKPETTTLGAGSIVISFTILVISLIFVQLV